MKRTVVFLLFLISIQATAQQEDPMVKIKVQEQVSVSIPASFKKIPEEALVSRYGMYRFPMAAYMGEENGDPTLFINKTAFNWGAEPDLEMLKESYKATISHYFYKVEFLTDTIITINKRQFIAIEYIGQVGKDQGKLDFTDTTSENRFNKFSATRKKVYSYRLYTVAEDKTEKEEVENKDKDDSKEIANERENQRIYKPKFQKGSMLPDQKQNKIVDKVNKSKKKPKKLENQKIFIFDFSCPESMRADWQAKAKKIMESIKIK